ncbi:MAG: hypothetical protein ACM32E_06845 [Gemmatimonadota bacterium]
MRPGSTQRPPASTTSVPAGTGRPAPTPVIRPSSIRTVPFSIGSPVTGTTRPPTIATLASVTVLLTAVPLQPPAVGPPWTILPPPAQRDE